MPILSGGQIVAQTLHAHGVDTVFCVAGESYLPVLDALLDYPSIRIVTCRHESGAAFMAEAYANLTGKPGIVMVTRGPGACNASIGIHTARQSSAPVIMLVGLVATHDMGKEAFQEFDLPQMFGSHTKHAEVIMSADAIASALSQAFYTSRHERPGPVVLGLPEDILSEETQSREIAPIEVHPSCPSAQDMAAVRGLLDMAQKPLVIVGGSGWEDADCAALAHYAGAAAFPVAASFRRQDRFDHAHECYVGDLGFGANPALVSYAKEADLILVIGARISEVLSQGYTLFGADQEIIHVYPSASAFGKAYRPALAVEAHPGPFIAALAEHAPPAKKWDAWRARGRKNFEDWTAKPAVPMAWKGADMTHVFTVLRDLLPSDAVITTDAGNFSGWVNRYLRFARPGRQIAPLSGAMGYAVPAAVGCSIAAPERLSVGVCGDGGFLMTGQELATAMHHKSKPIIIVCNNNMYGTIRMHQERDFPGRPVATDLTNPDFVKLAESYGVFGARVEDSKDFAGVWKAALASGRAALIEIRMDPRQIATTSKP